MESSAISRQLAGAPEAWVVPYVGIPWTLHGRSRAGVDCWGLVRLVLEERAGVALPSYGDGYEGADLAHLDAVAGVIRTHLGAWRAIWQRDAGALEAGEPRIAWERAQTLDVLLLRIWGRPMHVGIVVARNWMLHSQEGCDSVLEECDVRHWNRRIEGVYRHASL